ncbi:hypothetical protein QSE00_23075 [Arenibacter sp. M-2]|uniref:hypothetical protein n=1 Tax=Arenibacter sp. M-2 TaxID=3053612 RepID=UPI002570D0E9|nr:hypothetical protein [Arenibacter sp. M-2]MDL5514712.1 hypothetical protein [Arenibacter sp. M-2]
MILLKLIVIAVCAIIAYQDFKERAVLWLLFPVLAIGLLGLFSLNTTWEQLLAFATINFLIVSGILLLLYLYTKLIMKRKFLDVSFGLGDLFFFYALAVGFPAITFVILFVGALFSSLFITLFQKNKKVGNSVPLAGHMGIYLIAVLLISFSSKAPNLYVF